MPRLNKNIPIYFSLLCIFAILLILPEISGNPNTIYKYFHISTSLVLWLVTLLAIFLRLRGLRLLTKFVYKLLLLILPLLFIISLALSIISFITPTNYIYAKLHLNYDKLFFLTIFNFVLLILQQKNDFFKKNFKLLIFASGPILLFILSVIALWPFDRFLELVKEDHLIENTQFFVLFTGCFFAFLLSKNLFRKKKKILAIIFLFVAFGLLATAGDEISWGQRIFNIATPQNFDKINLQHETGFHNTIYVDDLVPFIYLLIGFYGTFAHLTRKLLSKKIPKELFSLFIPPPYLMFFFFIPFLYNFYTLGWEHEIGRWSEVAELFLYSGVSIFIIEDFHKTRK